VTLIGSAEACIRQWQESGEFLALAPERRAGLADEGYRLAGFGCAKVGYQLSEPIVWTRESLAGFEEVLARHGLAAEYGLYAHGKAPDCLELLSVKDIGTENAVYIDQRFPGNKEELLVELTESLTGVPEEAASETGPEVAEGRELVEAIEEFVDVLRGEADFLAVTRKREQAPRWHRLRFAGFACGKVGTELPVEIRWSPEVIADYERLLDGYDLQAAYGIYAHGKSPSRRLDALVIHDMGARSAIFLHRNFPRRGELLVDLLALFES
jgi:hypothetical protein